MEIIIKHIYSLTAAAGLLFGLCSCINDHEIHQDEDKSPSDVVLSEYTKIDTEIREISGMCANETGTGFYVASDECGIYEINLSGKMVREIWIHDGDHDFEGISLDKANRILYVLDETEQKIYTLTGENYSTRTEFAPVNLGTQSIDNGPEGLCYYGGKLYLCNQGNPTKVGIMDVATKQIGTTIDITFAKKYLSDIFYDATDNSLWIIDSKASGFFHCKIDGTLITKFKFNFEVTQGEAIWVDRAGKCFWVASDEKNGSPLYRIPYNF